ncbi:uncharacterized protein BDFB_001263 [Asbolus verrucosus]|uniref:Guided entry of tail-anchored proteins factor 1 n=1 Tax=Asbolus verrucosus TaxID=1661398 RepID=A0A482V8S1_ASBVE|nr:uncharacterized protein BDFB_001263 [Asbolus verrucosus]
MMVHTSPACDVDLQILKWLNKQTGKEKDLMSLKIALKNEQSSINMVDQFAKYSKIQRKINSIDEELQQINGKKPTRNFLVQLGFTYGVKSVLVLVLIVLSIYYRYTPVFYLGDKVNLVPFTSLICYPNDVNYVSFYFWVMCSAAVARLL